MYNHAVGSSNVYMHIMIKQGRIRGGEGEGVGCGVDGVGVGGCYSGVLGMSAGRNFRNGGGGGQAKKRPPLCRKK